MQSLKAFAWLFSLGQRICFVRGSLSRRNRYHPGHVFPVLVAVKAAEVRIHTGRVEFVLELARGGERVGLERTIIRFNRVPASFVSPLDGRSRFYCQLSWLKLKIGNPYAHSLRR